MAFFQYENGYIAHPIPTPIRRNRNSDHTMYFTRSIGRRRLRKPKAMENQQREEQHRLQMTELDSHFRVHALRLRAASYACSAASRFSTPAPAVARKRVP